MTLLAAERVDDLAGLAPDWAALWERCPEATPFQHPAWLLPWWAAFGTDRPRVAALRDGAGRLLGILPLYELGAEGKVLPVGAGLSDYLDVLVAPEAPADAATALLGAALGGCALPCHLVELPPGARLLQAAPPAGWQARDLPGETCPVLTPGGVPARQRRKWRMAQHRAERAGGARVEADDAEALFTGLLALHGAAWRARGETGVLADPRVCAFHAATLPALIRAGLLRLRGLRIAGDLAAVIHALRGRQALYFYLSGFNPARAFESPGTLLLGAMIMEAEAEDIHAMHFLRGAEPYKYAWGAIDQHNTTRILSPA